MALLQFALIEMTIEVKLCSLCKSVAQSEHIFTNDIDSRRLPFHRPFLAMTKACEKSHVDGETVVFDAMRTSSNWNPF